jgi:hypothetical protein
MLEASRLLDAARERTGLRDLGDEWFLTPMQWLVDSINQESRFTEAGAQIIPEMIIAHLVNHLELEHWYARHPEIEDEIIEAPLFGLGMPRTGSTALGHMMSLDPDTRALRVWEQDRHCPPPEAATQHSDPRIAISQAGEDAFVRLVPEIVDMLPRGVTKATECVFPLMECFSSGPSYELFVHVPTFSKLTEAPAYDMVPAYRYHRRILKLLQWRCPPRRWFLRTPAHTFDIEALLTVYPDANFVMTHREPINALSSVCSLVHHFRRVFVENPEPRYMGAMHQIYWAEALKRTLAARDRIGEHRFFDISHRRQVQDPAEQIRLLYAHYDWSYDPEMDHRIADWQEEHPKGNHRSDPAAFGLEPEPIAREFTFYTERFQKLL